MKLLLKLVRNKSGYRKQLKTIIEKSFKHIKGKKYACCCRTFYIRSCEKIWRTPCFNRWNTWYSRACRFLRLHHHHRIQSPYEKSIIERTVQYIKDKTEGFDDLFHVEKSKYRLLHIQQ